jgi:8-oxo-dGTP pyrophosphatase MutT (NUDIX family)
VPTPSTFAVSIKGVVLDSRQRVLLLKNERDEWELPGGRIELDESPEDCVAREIAEETRWKVAAGPVLDAWLYYISDVGRRVFIVTYGCYADSDIEPVLSHEHREVGLFERSEFGGLRMPDGYKRSISTWYERMESDPPPGLSSDARLPNG